jgi:uncharacterized protein YndB with AHSA1/START domain
MPNTVKLHRVFKAPAERVYRAFINADAYAQWIPPYGFTATVHSMNPEVGGSFKVSFTNFTTQKSHSFGGTFKEMVPGKLLKYTDKFDDANLPGEMLVTVNFRETMGLTELTVTQENLPDAIPVEFCYMGWQQSLKKLGRLVEPEIKDE